jgi:hypothetical protein
MTDKEIKEAIVTMQWNVADYDKGNESILLFEEDGAAFKMSVKALEAILEIRKYAEKTENSELREMLRLD